MKVCSKCKVEKELTEFRIRKTSKDGLYPSCKQCYKDYALLNKEHIKLRNKIWAENNKEHKKNYDKKYKELNKEKYISKRKENRDKTNKQRKIKRDTNHLYKLTGNIRRRILHCFDNKKINKKSKTYEILGCSFEEFKIHLEKQFTEGMCWDNQGEWHLDHIYPVSLAKDEEELIKLNHYTNFQPLWAIDNLRKSNKI